MSSDTEKIELLFKKNYGYPYARPGANLYSESAGNSAPRIYPSRQVFAQVVPPVAPYGSFSQDSQFPSNKGVRLTNASFPHIIKYEKLLLKEVTPLYSFWYVDATEAAPELNRLSNAIPPKYDRTYDSYAAYLYIDTGTGERSVGPNDIDYPWLFDNDAGYITFLKPLPVSTVVKITFWRYEGVFGFTSDSGATGSTGATGPQGIQGATGPTGSQGTNSWTPVLVNAAQGSGTFTRSGGSANTWDARVYSREGYSRGVSMSAKRSTGTGTCAFGLNSDPSTAGDYTNIDYGFYLTGNLAYVQVGAQTPINPVNISSNPTLQIIYDGQQVRFYMNADLLYATVRAIGVPLYLDMRLYSVDVSVENVAYGPMGEAGPTGPQGSTGPVGPVTTIEFDGGTPYTIYDVAPGLDCGGVE